VYDPPDCSGLAHFLSKTIDRGTAMRSADQIAEELDSRGVSLATSVTRQVLSLTCTCLAEDFEQVLAQLADIITQPSFPAAEVESRRSEVITLIRQDEDNPASVAVDGLMETLYGASHPYGRKLRGTVPTVERIDSAVLRAFHQSHVKPASVSLAMVGDIEPTRAAAAAARAFDGWVATPAAPIDIALPPLPAERRTRVIPMMNKAQADIAYGFITIARNDPAYYAFWLMNHIMGQYSMGGRLGDSIRERQGMAYYVYSSLDANLVPGPLMVRAGVSAANIARAVASIDAELTSLAADGPTEQELTDSKQYLVGSLPRTLETNAVSRRFCRRRSSSVSG
jgi:zinc protease